MPVNRVRCPYTKRGGAVNVIRFGSVMDAVARTAAASDVQAASAHGKASTALRSV